MSNDKVRVAAQELVEALDNTHWSSWQTTARFSIQQDALRDALAAARACVARGDVATVPREPTEAMLLTVQRLLPRWEAKAMWGAMHDAATRESNK